MDEQMRIKIVVVNKVRCKHCNDIIESTHRHDFKFCSCGKIAIDGGHDYQKILYPNTLEEDVDTSLSEYEYESL